MKLSFPKALLLIAATSALFSLPSCEKEDQQEETVSVYLTYTISANDGQEMPGTKATSSEVFDEFFQRIKTGELVAPSYNLTFTEKNSGAVYMVEGTWAGQDMITLRTGTYIVAGTSTATGENIQEKCSLKFEDEITLDTNSKTISLKANYDCSLIVFSDVSIAQLKNNNGISSSEFFKFNNYLYAFIHTKLYAEGKKEQAYLEGKHTNDSQFKIYTGCLSFEIGKFYVYNDIKATFDIDKMDEGGFEGYPIDLSRNETANCYIVSHAGSYRFKASTKGNSSEPIDGAPSKADVLWETFGTNVLPNVGDLIPSINYNDGYIYFNTPTTLVNGNAIIALRDASNNVLWSWHIWICEGFDPIQTEQEYKNNAGTMMDRNLGALSNEKGDILSFGLYYQWGRKDPFVGNTAVISSSLTTIPTLIAKNATTGTIAYSVANPFALVYSESQDWLNTADNGRWNEVKTKYDPCPEGWRVASGGTDGVWAIASGNSSQFTKQYDSNYHGIDCSDVFGCSNVWYPCAGFRESSTGAYNNREGDDLNVWSCSSATTKYAYYFDLNKPNTVLTSAGNNTTGAKSYSRNVRCQKIQ